MEAQPDDGGVRVGFGLVCLVFWSWWMFQRIPQDRSNFGAVVDIRVSKDQEQSLVPLGYDEAEVAFWFE